MNKIRVSCAQFRPEIGNVAFNLEKIASTHLCFEWFGIRGYNEKYYY